MSRIRVAGLAACAAVLLSGCASADPDQAHTAAAVQRAFTAEGLPLISRGSHDGEVLLHPTTDRHSATHLEVTVFVDEARLDRWREMLDAVPENERDYLFEDNVFVSFFEEATPQQRAATLRALDRLAA